MYHLHYPSVVHCERFSPHRHWPWVQSGFLTLHTLVMIMKMHSYMNINGYLQSVSEQAQELLVQLRKVTEEVGGWDEAVATAKQRRKELDSMTPRSDDSVSTPPVSASATATTFESEANGHGYGNGSAPANGNGNANGQAELRHRLNAAAAASSPLSSSSSSFASTDTMPATGVVTTGNRVLQPDEVLKPGPHPLVDHPDERISALARDFSELDSELISTGPVYVRWPANITYKNFAEYMLIPTLVYELEYPRTDRCVFSSVSCVMYSTQELTFGIVCLCPTRVGSGPCTSSRRRWRRSGRSRCCTR